jgi:hypothetical protein
MAGKKLFYPAKFPEARFWIVSGLPTIREPSLSGPNAICGYPAISTFSRSHFFVWLSSTILSIVRLKAPLGWDREHGPNRECRELQYIH